MIKIWIDGSSKPNPGKGGIGIVIRGATWDYPLTHGVVWDYTISEKCGDRVSNNQAEYRALNRALTELMKNECINKEIIVFSDSEMLTLQMSGEKKVDKGGAYVPDYMKAKQLLRYFTNIKFSWIPREENAEANLLASEAIRVWH